MANHGVSVILAADLPLFTSIIAMDSVSVRSGEDAGRAEWSIRSGAIPASPTSSRRRIPEAVSMDNDGTVGIFVGDIVKTSPGGRKNIRDCLVRRSLEAVTGDSGGRTAGLD